MLRTKAKRATSLATPNQRGEKRYDTKNMQNRRTPRPTRRNNYRQPNIKKWQRSII